MLALQRTAYLAAACCEGAQQALPCPALVWLSFQQGTPCFAAAFCAKHPMPLPALQVHIMPGGCLRAMSNMLCCCLCDAYSALLLLAQCSARLLGGMQALHGPSSGHHMRSQDVLLNWVYEDKATEHSASVKGKHPQGQQRHQSYSGIAA